MSIELTDEETLRYNRQIVLRGFDFGIYETVKDFVDHREERNFKRLCLKLQCSKRTMKNKWT